MWKRVPLGSYDMPFKPRACALLGVVQSSVFQISGLARPSVVFTPAQLPLGGSAAALPVNALRSEPAPSGSGAPSAAKTVPASRAVEQPASWAGVGFVAGVAATAWRKQPRSPAASSAAAVSSRCSRPTSPSKTGAMLKGAFSAVPESESKSRSDRKQRVVQCVFHKSTRSVC